MLTAKLTTSTVITIVDSQQDHPSIKDIIIDQPEELVMSTIKLLHLISIHSEEFTFSPKVFATKTARSMLNISLNDAGMIVRACTTLWDKE